MGQTFDEMLNFSPAVGDVIRLAAHGGAGWLGIYVGTTQEGFVSAAGWVLGIANGIGAVLDVVSLGMRVLGTHPEKSFSGQIVASGEVADPREIVDYTPEELRCKELHGGNFQEYARCLYAIGGVTVLSSGRLQDLAGSFLSEWNAGKWDPGLKYMAVEYPVGSGEVIPDLPPGLSWVETTDADGRRLLSIWRTIDISSFGEQPGADWVETAWGWVVPPLTDAPTAQVIVTRRICDAAGNLVETVDLPNPGWSLSFKPGYAVCAEEPKSVPAPDGGVDGVSAEGISVAEKLSGVVTIGALGVVALAVAGALVKK